MFTDQASNTIMGRQAGGLAVRPVIRRLALSWLALVAAACSPDIVAPAPTAAPWTPIGLGPTSTSAPAASPTAVTPVPSLVPLAPISDGDWSLGPKDAPITFVVYFDFQSPGSQKLDGVLKQLMALHPQEVRLIYRPFPLVPLHDKAALADEAAWAAAAQGAFWPMHDLLFARASEWTALSPEAFKTWLFGAAATLGLDVQVFRAELESRKYESNVAASYNQGVASGIPGTPYLFLNGDLYAFGTSLLNLEGRVRLILLEGRQYPAYPPMQISLSGHYVAQLHMNVGQIDIELWADRAPIAVNSFVFLARNGWYDGSPVFRVLPGIMVEAGDPTGTGIGGPGYTFDLETNPAWTFDRAGLVAMSNSGPGTNGSRFFVTLAPQHALDGARTIFGRVTAGLDRLAGLKSRDPLTDLLLAPESVIQSVTIEGP
ncbi:MAG: peptidylprolyl isomerase [Actinobacteria bacterium]|nr:peptidylprolyl isomerase [Actinomycetota bacterium]